MMSSDYKWAHWMRQTEIAVPATLDIKDWLSKIKFARSRNEVFAILDKFRPLEWTDEDRATMSKTYIRFLSLLGDTTPDAPAQPDQAAKPAADQSKTVAEAPLDEVADEPVDDGPVWYEKM
jgi:hypothetical protein